MTRKKVAASEKKQRHALAVRQIDAGMGLSELTPLPPKHGAAAVGLLVGYGVGKSKP